VLVLPKFVVLVFYPIVQLALFVLFLKQLRIAVESMSPPTFEDFLLELGKPIVEHKIASIFQLELAKFLPAFQLEKEYPSYCILCYTGFPSPVFKKFLVLPRMLEDVETKFDRVARPTVITNESFVGFSLYPQIFFDLFRVIRVEGGYAWGTEGRTFDPSMFYGRVSAYRLIALRRLSLTLVYPPEDLRPRQ